MIGQVLAFLRRRLDASLRAQSVEESATEKVVFIDGDRMDPLQFQLNTVTLMLVNVREERVLRAADRYRQPTADGKSRYSFPDIRLTLQLLFVASFKAYDESWEQLSNVIEHFQRTPVYNRQNAPDLPEGVEKLLFELVSLDFAAQNEIWNALRVNYHPSVVYKTSLIVVRDEQGELAPGTGEVERRIGTKSEGSP